MSIQSKTLTGALGSVSERKNKQTNKQTNKNKTKQKPKSHGGSVHCET